MLLPLFLTRGTSLHEYELIDHLKNLRSTLVLGTKEFSPVVHTKI